MPHSIVHSKSLGFGVGTGKARVEFTVAVYWNNAVHAQLARTMMDVMIMDAIDRFKQRQMLAGGHWDLERMVIALLDDEKLQACKVIVQDSFGHTSEGLHKDRYPLPSV